MCACGHNVCRECFLHRQDKVKEVMAKLHAEKKVKA